MFSQRLKELRRKAGFTQAQFAKEFNISTGTIGMWETGQRTPDIEMLSRIAKFFNVSVDYLLGISDGKEKLPTSNEEFVEMIRKQNKGKAQIFFCGADGEVIELSPEEEQLLKTFIEIRKKNKK